MKKFFYGIAAFLGMSIALFSVEKEAVAQDADRYYPGDSSYDCPQSGTSCIRLKTVTPLPFG